MKIKLNCLNPFIHSFIYGRGFNIWQEKKEFFIQQTQKNIDYMYFVGL